MSNFQMFLSTILSFGVIFIAALIDCYRDNKKEAKNKNKTNENDDIVIVQPIESNDDPTKYSLMYLVEANEKKRVEDKIAQDKVVREKQVSNSPLTVQELFDLLGGYRFILTEQDIDNIQLNINNVSTLKAILGSILSNIDVVWEINGNYYRNLGRRYGIC